MLWPIDHFGPATGALSQNVRARTPESASGWRLQMSWVLPGSTAASDGKC
jgi:hypothetical protein